jgi:hypothetical protein
VSVIGYVGLGVCDRVRGVGCPPPSILFYYSLQDVIRTICSPYGFVQRVVVFRKNGLQVLVEYPHLVPICCEDSKATLSSAVDPL